MTRIALLSSALALIASVSGCERRPTEVPEPAAEKADLSPPEEYELAGANGDGEVEDAPGLSDG